MPKRKISSGPTQPQQDCSDGAKMLIEQMKLHPEEFKGYAGKFTAMLDAAHDIQHNSAIRGMSKRDAAAILAAAEEHLYEVWLAADVLTKMMAPKPEVEKDMVYATPVKAGLWQGAVPNPVYTGTGVANTISNNLSSTSTSQYINEAYRMEMDKYKMEMQKMEMERQRHQENEYALRNTKPFGKFV